MNGLPLSRSFVIPDSLIAEIKKIKELIGSYSGWNEEDSEMQNEFLH